MDFELKIQTSFSFACFQDWFQSLYSRANLTLVMIDQNTPNFAMFIVLKCLYNIIFLKSTEIVKKLREKN